MKNLWLFSMMLLLAFSACKKDEEEPIEDLRTVLSYDGDNQDAPELPDATYDFAVRFPADQMAQYKDRKLEQVSFYIFNKPATCEVVIYGQGGADSTGVELYQADVGAAIESNAWNDHTLATPLELTGEDIWVTIRAKHNGITKSVGCDAGPAKTNGDWIYDSQGTAWLTFRTHSNNEVDINWNIKAYLADE